MLYTLPIDLYPFTNSLIMTGRAALPLIAWAVHTHTQVTLGPRGTLKLFYWKDKKKELK